MLKRISLIIIATITLSACASQTLKKAQSSFDGGDYHSSYEKVLPLAQQGNPDAEYAVGYMMYYGKGTATNKKEGIEWINKAAAQGQTQAIQAQHIIAKQLQLNPLSSK